MKITIDEIEKIRKEKREELDLRIKTIHEKNSIKITLLLVVGIYQIPNQMQCGKFIQVKRELLLKQLLTN